MLKEFGENTNFDDIVFRIRNREYGAFVLRKKYNRNVIISLLIAVIFASSVVFTQYLNAKSMAGRKDHTERQVEIVMQNLDQPHEIVAPPPPPPPPPENVMQQVKYVPPVIVDSVKLEDNVRLMTADEVREKVKDKDVVEAVKEVKEEVQDKETEQQPFLLVQEMPEPMGGAQGLYKYIADNTQYPVMAKENNIQGKVYVRFCVTAKGTVDQVSIIKGVDTDLDTEALRIVKSFPPFKPGKQDGKPVPVWFNVAINFQLN
jgi:periplasmic protein TonB